MYLKTTTPLQSHLQGHHGSRMRWSMFPLSQRHLDEGCLYVLVVHVIHWQAN
jgi:hypothetical protein